MTLMSHEQEQARAEDAPAFTDGLQSQAWMHAWCDRCVHERTCPLLTVAFLDMTPFGWVEANPSGLLDRYQCVEFTARPDVP